MKAVAILLIALALSGCASQVAQLPSANATADPWSAACARGTYAVYSGDNFTCVAPRSCASSKDCGYLEIDKLPPRVGYCEQGRCMAACGSGISRPCVN